MDKNIGQSNRKEQTRHLMRCLEEYAEVDRFTACCLMIELWPVANNLCLHDVCDSIGLWVHDSAGPDLINHVRNIPVDEFDEKTFQYWVDLISATSTKK